MRKILLVEDNPATIEVMQVELRHLGYDAVVIAKDGNEAVQLAKVEPPDLIIMDISLPNLNGLQAATILRRGPNTKDIPILAATGRARPGDREKCLAAGCSDYLAKPFTFRQLGSMIEKLSKPG